MAKGSTDRLKIDGRASRFAVRPDLSMSQLDHTQ